MKRSRSLPVSGGFRPDPIRSKPCAFEVKCLELGLITVAEIIASKSMQSWIEKNMGQLYIPTSVLTKLRLAPAVN